MSFDYLPFFSTTTLVKMVVVTSSVPGTTDLNLGNIKTYGTLSGYLYLHLPKLLCRQFSISPSTHFDIIYRDGDLILKLVKESKDDT